jgi:hypothetical protein
MKTKIKDLFMYLLGAMIAVGTFALIILLILVVIKNPDSPLKDVLIMSIGSIQAAFGLVVGYFYGSSKGSADKSDVINQNLKTNDQ